jgi:hypothetical protein
METTDLKPVPDDDSVELIQPPTRSVSGSRNANSSGMPEKEDDLNASLTEAELASFQDQTTPVHARQESLRRFNVNTRQHSHQRSSMNVFGGFGELNREVKLHRRIRDSTTKDGKYETLDNLYTGSSKATELEERRIKFLARGMVIRRSVAFTLLLLLAYLVVGVTILLTQADLGFQQALLYCVYTMVGSRDFLNPKGTLWIVSCLLWLTRLLLFPFFVSKDEYRLWICESATG